MITGNPTTPPTAMPLGGIQSPATPPIAAMTPDAVLAYCEQQFNGINQQFDNCLNQSQTTAGLTTDLNNVKTAIDANASAGFNANGGDADDAALAAANSSIDTAINDAQAAGNPALVQNLQDIKTALNTSNGVGDGTDNKVTPADIQSINTQIDSASSSLSSQSQMQMISLQSVVSQQNSALQLATNLIQTIGDEGKSVASNIGH